MGPHALVFVFSTRGLHRGGNGWSWCGIDVHGLHRGDLHAVRLPVGGDAWLAVILLQPGNCFVACSWYWSCCASVSACVLGATTWFTRCQLSANETGLGGSCTACKLHSAEPDSCRHRVESFDVPVLGCYVFAGCYARLTLSLLEARLGHEMAKDHAGARLPRRGTFFLCHSPRCSPALSIQNSGHT